MSEQLYVVVLDDDDSSRTGVVDDLVSHGVSVDSFEHGEQLLQHLDRHPFRYDALLMDLGLNEPKEARDTFDAVRSAYPQLSIIVYTSSQRVKGRKFFADGAIASLVKPLQIPEVITKVLEARAQLQIHQRLAEEFKDILGANACVVWRLNRSAAHLKVGGCKGEVSDAFRALTLPLHEAPLSTFLEERRVVYVRNCRDRRSGYRHPKLAEEHGWEQLLSLPLIHHGSLWGLVDCYYFAESADSHNLVQQKDNLILAALCKHSAETLYHVESTRRERILKEINQTVADVFEENVIVKQVLAKALELVDADASRLYGRDFKRDNLRLIDCGGTLTRTQLDSIRALGDGISGTVAEAGYSYVTNNVIDDPYYKPIKGLAACSEIAVPLRRGKQTIGVLTVTSRHCNYFSMDDRDILKSLASIASTAITRTRYNNHIRKIGELTLAGDTTPTKMHRYVVDAVHELTGEKTSLWLLRQKEEDGDDFLRMVAGRSVPEGYMKGQRLPADRDGSISGRALATGKPIVRNNIRGKSRKKPPYRLIEEAKEHGWNSFMTIPMIGREGEKIGVVAFYSEETDRFTLAEADQLRLFADQAAIAFQQQRRVAGLKALAEVGKKLTASLIENPKALFQQAVDTAKEAIGADLVVLYPFDPFRDSYYDSDNIKFAGVLRRENLSTRARPSADGMAFHTRQIGRFAIFNVDDEKTLRVDNGVSQQDCDGLLNKVRGAKFIQEEGVKAFVGVSLRTREDALKEVGVIYFNYRAPRQFTEEELLIIRIFCHQLANIIGGARSYQETRLKIGELSAINSATTAMLKAGNTQRTVEELLAATVAFVSGGGGKLYLANERKQQLRLIASSNISQQLHDTYKEVAYGEGLSGRVASTRTMQLAPVYAEYPHRIEEYVGAYHTIVGFPLVAQGELLGVLSIFGDETQTFGNQEIEKLQRFVLQAALVIQNARLLEDARKQSVYFDTLAQIAPVLFANQSETDLSEELVSHTTNLLKTEKVPNIAAAYWYVNENQKRVELDFSTHAQWHGRVLQYGRGLAGVVAETGEGAFRNDYGRWEHRSDQFASADFTVQNAIAVPIKEGDRTVAVLSAADQTGNRRFDATDVSFLQQYARLVHAVMQNAERVRQLDAVRNASRAISENITLEEVCTAIFEQWHPILGFESASIHRFRRNGRRKPVSVFRVGEDEVPKLLRAAREDALIQRVLNENGPLILSDVSVDHDWQKLPETEAVNSWVGLALYFQGKPVGILFLEHSESRFFSEARHANLLKMLGNQAAIAFQKAQLLNKSALRERDLQIVGEVARVITARLDLQGLLKEVVRQVHEKLNCSHCTVYLTDGDEACLKAKETSIKDIAELKETFLVGEGFAGWVFENGESILSHDAHADERFVATGKPEGPRSLLVSPIYNNEKCIGVICADQDEFNHFTDHNQKLLEAIGQFIGIGLNNATLYGEEKRRVQEEKRHVQMLKLLHDVSRQITRSNGVKPVIDQVLQGACKVSNTNAAILYLIDTETETIKAQHQWPGNLHHKRTRFDSGTGYTRLIYDTEQPYEWHGSDVNDNTIRGEPVTSIFGVPLSFNHKVIGVLFLNSLEPRSLDEVEWKLLQMLAEQAAIAIGIASRNEVSSQLAQQLGLVGRPLPLNIGFAIEDIERLKEALVNIDKSYAKLKKYADKLKST